MRNARVVRAVVLAVLIGAVGAAAVADAPRIFGEPFMLEPTTVLGPAYSGQGEKGSAVVKCGAVFLAAWNDDRCAWFDYDYQGAMYEERLYIGRIQPDGTVLDPVGIQLVEGGNEYVGASCNGENVLMVSESIQTQPSVSARLLNSQGVLLNSPYTCPGEQPAVASDGSGWIMVFTRLDSVVRHVYGARIGPDGVAIAPPSRLCQFESDQTCPSVAWNGTDYVVAFRDERNVSTSGSDIYALRVAPDGTVHDPDGFAVCNANGDQNWTACAASGSTVLVACEDKRNGSTADIYTARVRDTGAVDNTNGRAVCTAAGDDLSPKAVGNADGWVVVWEDNRTAATQVYRARIGLDGRSIDPDGVPVFSSANFQTNPNICLDSSECVVCWSDSATDWPLSREVLVRRFDLSGVPLDTQPFPICQTGQYQRSPRLARTTSGFMTVYAETPDILNPDLYIAPLDSDGHLTGAGRIALKADAEYDVEPVIASDGQNCLVAWKNSPNGQADNLNILATRVTPSGGILDSPPIVVCNAPHTQTTLCVAYGGGVYLVVWSDDRASSRHIYGARVRPDGTLLDPNGFLIGSNPIYQDFAAVGSDGSRFLVTWMEYVNSYASIVGRIVDPDHPGGSPPQFVIEQGAHPPFFRQSAVASSGSNYLVASTYFSRPNDYSPIYLRARRVGLDGTLLDPSPLPICYHPTEKNITPIVCWNGQSYVIEWIHVNPWHHTLYVNRVLENGEVIDGSGIPVPGEMTSYPGGLRTYDSCICPKGDGTVLIAWEQFDLQPPYGVDRIMESWYMPPEIVHTIAAAKAMPEDSPVTIVGKPVSAGTDDLAGVFYIEETNQSSGMRVLWSKGSAPRGSTAVVSGSVETVGGERLLRAQYVDAGALGTEPIKPLGMSNKWLGGRPSSAIVPEIPGAWGAYNVGLLVKAWGKVTAVETVTPPAKPRWLYIDDGAGLDDGSGNTGVKVTLTGLVGGPPDTIPEEGDYVVVTGLSSCEIPDSKTAPVRLLRPRCRGDISIMVHKP